MVAVYFQITVKAKYIHTTKDYTFAKILSPSPNYTTQKTALEIDSFPSQLQVMVRDNIRHAMCTNRHPNECPYAQLAIFSPRQSKRSVLLHPLQDTFP